MWRISVPSRSTSSSSTCIRSRPQSRNRTSGSRTRSRTSISAASPSSGPPRRTPHASASSSGMRATERSSARCRSTAPSRKNSEASWRWRRSSTPLATTPRFSTTSRNARGACSRRRCAWRTTRSRHFATAKAMKKDVLDAVIAPEYEPAALDLLKSKKKGTFLVLRTRGPFRRDHGIDMVRVLGGVLLQTTDFPMPQPEAFKVVTKVSPTPAQLRDILFGILVSRYVKSNSIVLVKGDRTVGIGAGQMSRVDACMLACHKADAAARGSVAVSDAYFPVRDGVDELAKGGVAMVAQPGGSIRDDEVIAAADEHGIGMVFTGIRLFKH